MPVRWQRGALRNRAPPTRGRQTSAHVPPASATSIAASTPVRPAGTRRAHGSRHGIPYPRAHPTTEATRHGTARKLPRASVCTDSSTPYRPSGENWEKAASRASVARRMEGRITSPASETPVAASSRTGTVARAPRSEAANAAAHTRSGTPSVSASVRSSFTSSPRLPAPHPPQFHFPPTEAKATAPPLSKPSCAGRAYLGCVPPSYVGARYGPARASAVVLSWRMLAAWQASGWGSPSPLLLQERGARGDSASLCIRRGVWSTPPGQGTPPAGEPRATPPPGRLSTATRVGLAAFRTPRPPPP